MRAIFGVDALESGEIFLFGEKVRFKNPRQAVRKGLGMVDVYKRQDTYHMVEFTAARIERANEDECWCVLVFRDIQEEFLLEQKRNVEISQLATAARVAYQMVIAVNLTRNSYHMVEYERYPVKEPGREGCFVDLIEHELSTCLLYTSTGW